MVNAGNEKVRVFKKAKKQKIEDYSESSKQMGFLWLGFNQHIKAIVNDRTNEEYYSIKRICIGDKDVGSQKQN